MNRRCASLSFLLTIAGCSGRSEPDEAIPGTLVVDRIERQLAGRPCIGALDRWERHYFHAAGDPPAVSDRNVVFFTFVEAGVDDFAPGRRIERLRDQFIYDGLARVAFGQFVVGTGALTLDYCGPNSPPDPAQLNALLAR